MHMRWTGTRRYACIPVRALEITARPRQRAAASSCTGNHASPNPDAPISATCPPGAKIPGSLKSRRSTLSVATPAGRNARIPRMSVGSVHGLAQTPTRKIAGRRRVAGVPGRGRTRKGVGGCTSHAGWTAKWTAMDDPWTTRHPLVPLILLGFGRLGRLGQPLIFLELREQREPPSCGQRADPGRKGARGRRARRRAK